MSFLWSILGFILVIGILVAIHEWGHYQVARWFDIKVIRFSIGFGKPICTKQGKETEFQVAMIPIGGYVKFVDEREGPVDEEDVPRAFNRQSVYKRFAVVAAGPLINLIFAWLVFTAIYLIGVSGIKPIFEQPLPGSPLEQVLPNNQQAWLVLEANEKPVTSWMTIRDQLLKALIDDQSTFSLKLESIDTGEVKYLGSIPLSNLDLEDKKQDWMKAFGFQRYAIPLPPHIGSLKEDAPAALAGIEVGDLITKIDGQSISVWQDLVKTVSNLANQTVEVELQRGSVLLTKQVTIVENSADTSKGYLGVGVYVDESLMKSYTITSQYGLFESIQLGWQKNLDFIDMSLVMMKKMLFGEVGLDNLSGPVSIAQFSGQALQTGVISFLTLLGLLSLSLGILNLLPIPVLDGGHLVYYIVEMIKGSPVSEGVMVFGQKIGLLLIISLTVLALTNDLIRITNG
ncbi:MAG: RIP metalloprotease RseP [Thiotrichales bacterium]|nr:RIP metalloprotease RseP [Thiotrichales bacterium]